MWRPVVKAICFRVGMWRPVKRERVRDRVGGVCEIDGDDVHVCEREQ